MKTIAEVFFLRVSGESIPYIPRFWSKLLAPRTYHHGVVGGRLCHDVMSGVDACCEWTSLLMCIVTLEA